MCGCVDVCGCVLTHFFVLCVCVLICVLCVCTSARGVNGKWHVVFESDSNRCLQQVYKSNV